jgi:hypothetical protein
VKNAQRFQKALPRGERREVFFAGKADENDPASLNFYL